MSIYMLCLANSYKLGGRCIAGIQLKKTSNGRWTVVVNRDTKTPKWVRPISKNPAGEIPNHEAVGIDILSIIEVVNPDPHPELSHSENIYYDQLVKTGERCVIREDILDLLCDNCHGLIFGNKGWALTLDAFKAGGYSVMLIKVENAEIYLDTDKDKHKERIKFVYKGNCYDFPITDPLFLDRLKINPDLNSVYKYLYLVISLGVEFNGWHTKLAATIIDPTL